MERVVDVFWIARYDYEPCWVLEPHTHDYFQIVDVIDGTGTAELDGHQFQVSADQILLIAPDVSHGIRADRGCSVKTLDTKFNVYSDELYEALCEAAGVRADPHHRIRQTLERVRSEGMRQQPWYRHLCNAYMLQALVTLVRHHGSLRESGSPLPAINSDHDLVKRTTDVIESEYGSEITLADISLRVGYSAAYLSRVFSHEAGISVHHYLMQVRIERAKELLQYSDESIKQIAFATGFKSIHHFGRAFKDAEGVPPARWRDQQQEGIWQNVVIAPGFVNRDITITPNDSSRG